MGLGSGCLRWAKRTRNSWVESEGLDPSPTSSMPCCSLASSGPQWSYLCTGHAGEALRSALD